MHNLITLTPVDSDVIQKVNKYSHALLKKNNFHSITNLISQFLSMDESIEVFIYGWAALEKLVTKIFKDYEKIFIEQIKKDSTMKALGKYFDRIQNVMKDKYTLVDKFTLIASFLSTNQFEEDIEDFKEIKKVRDKLLHGEEISEASLPYNKLKRVLFQYFASHLKYSSKD